MKTTPPKAAWAIFAAFLIAGGWLGAINLLDENSNSAHTGSGATDDNDFMSAACDLPRDWVTYLHRGWDDDEIRGWDIAAVPRKKGWFGSFLTTSHSGPFDHLQEVPLVFYGPGFIQSSGPIDLDRKVTLADVPVTQARLLHLDNFEREGKVIDEILKPTRRSPTLIVTLVIDGGGSNVLEEVSGTWPNLAELMDEGTSIQGAVVGSSPSITPAVHTTLATGVWPSEHGVMAIVARADDGSIVSGFAQEPYLSDALAADPTVNLDATTLADEWDLATDNKSEVVMIAAMNYHLGMIGHGASLEGADKDLAAIAEDRKWATNPRYFSLPTYVNEDVTGPAGDFEDVDVLDGKADGKWRGHGFEPLRATPAFSAWETRTLEEIVVQEQMGDDGTADLLYINYKAPDSAGHTWNMIAPEQRDAVKSVDTALGRVVQFLNTEVGRENYVLTVTADHGQTPLSTRGWPINQREIKRDLEARFDVEDNDQGIVQTTSTAIYFMNREEMEANDVSPEEVATFLSHYSIRDNIPEGNETPRGYESRLDEEVFAGLIPGRQMDAVAECAGVETKT